MSERLRRGLGTWLLLLLLATGCSLDTSPIVRSGAGGSAVGAPTKRSDATTSFMDGGPARDAGRQTSTIDASADSGASRNLQKDASTGATPDAGGLRQPQDASAKSPMPDSGPLAADDAAAPNIPTTPAPGEQFARCTADVSCNGDLKCYSSGPGYCAEPCQSDSDCTDFDGFDFTCYQLQGACRVDCGPDGTKGQCPSLLVCVTESTGDQRCMLPREQGTGDKKFLEPCDIGHGSGDCVPGLTCYRAGLTAVDGPGYCTQPCTFVGMGGGMGGMDCQSLMDPGAHGATFICTVRSACALTCSGSMCNAGMDCEPIGQESYCHYPAGP